MEAAASAKMAERGQIIGALVDGPMPFDTAISEEAAQRKGVTSRRRRQGDVLVVPDLEAGQMLVKQLQYLMNAQAVGLILGARVPIIVPGREDTARTREAACAWPPCSSTPTNSRHLCLRPAKPSTLRSLFSPG